MTSDTKSKIETRFEDPGSLLKPGPIGRTVRLLWGVFLAWVFVTLLAAREVFFGTAFPWEVSLAIAVALVVFPYVVNIGFGQNWRHWPRIVVAVLIVLGMVLNGTLYGTVWSPGLGWFVFVWLLYFCGHLGISFLVASIIATPGCEMRALPHLWTLLTGRETKEHYCPGHIGSVDKWEARWKSAQRA